MGRQDALVLDTQTQPPHVELREPVNAGGGERHAIVGAKGSRQAILAEESVEDRTDTHPLSREQPVTRQQIARVLIGHRQRIAIEPIARAEVALEVGRPEIVGLRRRGRDDTGMLIVSPPAPLPHQPAAGQEIARGAHGRPPEARVTRLQPRQELGRPPAWMLPARRADQYRDLPAYAMGTVVGRPAAITQGEPAALFEAREPFVAGLAADAVTRAEFGHGLQVQPAITNEPLSLLHG